MSLPKLFTKKLIYTISWEDVQIDTKLLGLDQNSSMLTIASAGDHLLNYSLEGVRHIHAVDINPAQLYLVELKKIVISTYDFEVYWSFFGLGKVPDYPHYFEGLLDELTPGARKFWKRKQHLFDPDRKGFYRYGTTGWLSRLLLYSLRRMGVLELINELIYSEDLDSKKILFESLWYKMSQHMAISLWIHPWVLYLGGIPRSQQQSIGPLLPFLKDTLYTILVEQQLSQNPYWRLYWNGYYSLDFAPKHLQKKYFESLKESILRISIGHSSLLYALQHSRSNSFSHVNLLDHQDWLYNNQKRITELRETWSTLNTCTSIKKILFRSSYETVPWIDSLTSKNFTVTQMKRKELKSDQVYSYSSTYLLSR